jgi:hypothetical protein
MKQPWGRSDAVPALAAGERTSLGKHCTSLSSTRFSDISVSSLALLSPFFGGLSFSLLEVKSRAVAGIVLMSAVSKISDGKALKCPE